MGNPKFENEPPISDRELRTKDALERIRNWLVGVDALTTAKHYCDHALAAYDEKPKPEPERVYVIPELTEENYKLLQTRFDNMGFYYARSVISEVYSAIRDFTAKEKP